jgi:hypothetical protein
MEYREGFLLPHLPFPNRFFEPHIFFWGQEGIGATLPAAVPTQFSELHYYLLGGEWNSLESESSILSPNYDLASLLPRYHVLNILVTPMR